MNAPAKTVAVVMGGWSAERPVSLVSGEACAQALDEAGYCVTRIDVTHDLPALLEALTPPPDAVFNALHGRGGEDGCIQGVLEMLRIPYTHSGVRASSIAMDKPATKRLLQTVGIASPEGVVTTAVGLDHTEVPFAAPYVVKPANEGSSVGVHIVRAGDNRSFTEDWQPDTRLLIERYIPGRRIDSRRARHGGSCGKSGWLSRKSVPLEGFYDYDNKYTDGRPGCPRRAGARIQRNRQTRRCSWRYWRTRLWDVAA